MLGTVWETYHLKVSHYWGSLEIPLIPFTFDPSTSNERDKFLSTARLRFSLWCQTNPCSLEVRNTNHLAVKPRVSHRDRSPKTKNDMYLGCPGKGSAGNNGDGINGIFHLLIDGVHLNPHMIQTHKLHSQSDLFVLDVFGKCWE